MEYIVITDLYGNRLERGNDSNGALPFIILTTVQPYLLLEKIAERDSDSVYKWNSSMVAHTLYYWNVRPENYNVVGHIYSKAKNLPKQMQFIFVNKNMSKKPIDFKQISSYKNFPVWEPVCPNGYKALGLIVSIKKPDINIIRVVKENGLTPYRKKIDFHDGFGFMNEFNLLSTESTVLLTVNRTKFLNKNINLSVKNKKINYTAQGELKMGDKCMSIQMNDNYVYLQDCDDKSDNQKWYPYRGQFVSQYNEKCLDKNLKAEPCNKDQDQQWNTTKNDDSWKTQHGKGVSLSVSDTPWYKDRETEYQPYAKYQTNFMMDPQRPDLGYGWSYADRLGRDCLCANDCDKLPSNPKDQFILENFEGEPSSSVFSNTSILLLGLLIFLIIVRQWFNRHKTEN